MTDVRGSPSDADLSSTDLLTQARALRGKCAYHEARAVIRRAVSSAAEPAPRSNAPTDPPLCQSQLLLGELEEHLGDPDAAESAYLAAVASAESAPPPGRHILQVRSLTRLSSVLQDRGALIEAQEALNAALATAQIHLQDGLEHAEALAEQSRQRLDIGAQEAAETCATRAVQMTDAAPQSDARDETRTRVLGAFGTVLRSRGRYAEAYPVLQDALASAETAFGPSSLEVANALNDLGICGKFSGRFDEGVEHYQRALEVFDATVGLENPNVAGIYHNLGGILHARQEFESAEPWARRAVELREHMFGPDHVSVAADRAALSSILFALGRLDEAESLLREALSCLESTYGPDNHDVVANYGNLAAIIRQRGDLQEAERLYRQQLAAKKRLFGGAHPEVAITLNNLAVVCRRRVDEAEELYRQAIDILSNSVEPTHPALSASRDNLARLLQNREHSGEASSHIITERPAEQS